jgi:FKBP-type peptidyl-prolyl cis-trans isomerase 2
MVDRSPSLLLIAVLTVVAIVVAGVGAGLLYESNHPKSTAGPLTVQVGDNVTVNYIGIFGSGPEQGRVFDTSIKSVADNNASYPKSLQYSPRSAGGYTPLPVHVGPGTPSSGYTVGNVTYGGVVTGFWQGLVGLQANQTRWVTVPPNLGYGPLVPSCLRTAPIRFTLPTVVVDTPSGFNTSYAGVLPQAGVHFVDPTYSWPDTVLSANSSAVVVENLPSVGWTSSPNGWPVTVLNVTSQSITLLNELTTSDAGLVKGHLAGSTVCSSSDYIVSAVNLVSQNFTENFNREVVGQTLIFVVTVVGIHPP